MKPAYARLLPLAIVASLLSLPLPASLLAAIVAVLLVFAGLRLGAPHGLGSEVPSLKRAAVSLLIGAISGAVILAMLPLVGLEARMSMDAALPLWQRFVMSFNAAVLEEIAFRLFVVSLVTWVFARFVQRNTAVWIGILAGVITFGAAHLPRWIEFGAAAMTAVMFVNGAIAIVLGLVYVKWGIEAAMIAHFGGDIVVHVIGPPLFV